MKTENFTVAPALSDTIKSAVNASAASGLYNQWQAN